MHTALILSCSLTDSDSTGHVAPSASDLERREGFRNKVCGQHQEADCASELCKLRSENRIFKTTFQPSLVAGHQIPGNERKQASPDDGEGHTAASVVKGSLGKDSHLEEGMPGAQPASQSTGLAARTSVGVGIRKKQNLEYFVCLLIGWYV